MRVLMRILLLIAAVLFMSALAAPARAGIAEYCFRRPSPDLTISSCTAMIRSGEKSEVNLIIAYTHRGLAYSALGEYRRAIEDYDQTLRLDPGYPPAKANRASALESLTRRGKTYGQPGSGLIYDGPNRETVRSAQRLLAQLEMYEGEIDGIVGPSTRRALRQFQEEWG